MVRLNLLLVLLSLLSCKHDEFEKNDFELYGRINESNSDIVVLSYLNDKEIYVCDSVKVIRGKFDATGKINGPTMASISGDVFSSDIDDLNYTEFFLEPKKISISLIKNNFKEANVRGSLTNDLYIDMKSQVSQYYRNINLIEKKRNSLFAYKNKSGSNDSIEMGIQQLTNDWASELRKIEKRRLEYAKNSPNSYLASYFVSLYRKKMTKDSLKFYFNNFNSKIKTTIYAKRIESEIKNIPLQLGDIAPAFEQVDSNGITLSLKQFKGKFVLLDFWAGWCVPCIENHPELKRLYHTYNSKGFEIIGISFDKNEKLWLKNIGRENINWHHIFVGLNNIKKNDALNMKYDIQPIPAYVLIDREGYILGRYLNADPKYKGLEDLDKKLKELFEISVE